MTPLAGVGSSHTAGLAGEQYHNIHVALCRTSIVTRVCRVAIDWMTNTNIKDRFILHAGLIHVNIGRCLVFLPSLRAGWTQSTVFEKSILANGSIEQILCRFVILMTPTCYDQIRTSTRPISKLHWAK